MEQEIKDLITKYLLKDVNIDNVYKKLSDGETDIISTKQLQDFYRQWEDIGTNFQTDLPFWYNSKNDDKNKPTLMIIAQDANNDRDENEKCLIINAPFSVQQHKDKDDVYENILKPLKDDYRIYLTDLYKLFFWYKRKILNQPYEAKSHDLPTYIYNEIHYKFLIEEINIMQPDLIVTFGGKARDAIRTISGDTIKFRDEAMSKDKLFYRRKKGYELTLNNKTFKFAPILHPAKSVRDNLWKTFLKNNDCNDLDRVSGTVEIIKRLMEEN